MKYKFNETYRTVDPIQRMLALEKFIEGQNKARRRNVEKDSHGNFRSMLEIRYYENEEKKE